MVYNEKVMEIFQNPKNVGKLKGANAIGQVGNVACGDIMKIYLKINENEVIEDASFETFGCAAAIVSSSIATELIKGWTVEQALNFDNDMIIKEVGELPVHKIHCSVLAKEAIEDAILKYRKKQAKADKKEDTKEIKDSKVNKNTKSSKTANTEKTISVKVKKTTDKSDEYKPVKAKNVIAKKDDDTHLVRETTDFKSALSALKNAKSEKVEQSVVDETSNKEEVVNEKIKKSAKKEVIKEEVFEFDNKSLKSIDKDLKKQAKEKKSNAKKLDKNFLSLTKRINKL